MLVSYNWLKQYTNVEDNANALAEKITILSIPIFQINLFVLF